MISLLVLGTGGAVPAPGRANAAYHVTVDGFSLLVDPGPGAVSRLLNHPAGPDDPAAITTVVVTHFHPDHCHDLAALLFARHSVLLRDAPPLQVIGPPGLRRYLAALDDLYGSWLEPAGAPLRADEVPPGRTLVPGPGGAWVPAADAGGAAGTPALQTFAARHGETRYAEANLCLRWIDGAGRSLAYSGDSEPCPGLVAAARDADLLVVECSTPDALATAGHMSPARVARLCAEARPRRVALTHLYPPAAALDLPALLREPCGDTMVVLSDGDVLVVPEQRSPRPPTPDEESP